MANRQPASFIKTTRDILVSVERGEVARIELPKHTVHDAARLARNRRVAVRPMMKRHPGSIAAPSATAPEQRACMCGRLMFEP